MLPSERQADAESKSPNDVLSRTFKAIRKDGFFLSAAGQRLQHAISVDIVETAQMA